LGICFRQIWAKVRISSYKCFQVSVSQYNLFSVLDNVMTVTMLMNFVFIFLMYNKTLPYGHPVLELQHNFSTILWHTA
jgi:hypothetical protein